MGEIKTFFDLISTRGMAFVTYAIDDNELRAKFETYGEIRSVKPFKDSPWYAAPINRPDRLVLTISFFLHLTVKVVEWWDIRACEAAHDSLDGSQYLAESLNSLCVGYRMVPKGRPKKTGWFYGPDVGQDDYEHDDQINYESYALITATQIKIRVMAMLRPPRSLPHGWTALQPITR
ncbi:hypothetical protein KEM48_005799 [Puccinia striiformis f. sp. tritici PST-130]|nr:hypothetical protein KEM48_005799 [Puccinia striiformis f. sp. tritici PST-130]